MVVIIIHIPAYSICSQEVLMYLTAYIVKVEHSISIIVNESIKLNSNSVLLISTIDKLLNNNSQSHYRLFLLNTMPILVLKTVNSLLQLF